MKDHHGRFENVAISEAVRKESGFSDQRIAHIFRNPSQTHELSFHGLRMRFYTKSFPHATDLIAIFTSPEKNFTAFAFRIFPEVSDKSIAELPPLDLLQAFVEKYGLECSVAGKVQRFFLAESVPIANNNWSKVVEVLNPKDVPCIAPLSFMVDSSGGIVHVAVVFSIDIAAYTESLNRGGRT